VLTAGRRVESVGPDLSPAFKKSPPPPLKKPDPVVVRVLVVCPLCNFFSYMVPFFPLLGKISFSVFDMLGLFFLTSRL